MYGSIPVKNAITCDSKKNQLSTCDFMTFNLFKTKGFARGSSEIRNRKNDHG